VRIERIRVDAFGRLSGFDSGAETLGHLVVVLGPNEAGKSTLFAFLTTALYGFHPASRDRNPHVPWGEDEASGRIEVTVGDGACAQIERRLRATPSGRLTEAGVTRELRNQPVPWADHVPHSVFRQVFAVTLADLAGLDLETWAGIQERLVGSMGSTDLGSARGTAAALEREASELWRPSRRGNQRLRDLQAEIRALRARRGAALERDREIRRLVEERDNVEVRLREVRAERQEHRLVLDRVQTLIPVRRQLVRIDALRVEGGDRAPLDALPPDPAADLGALRADVARLQEHLSLLDVELRDPQAALAAFGHEARVLLERSDEITRFLSAAAEAAPERRRVRELEAELDELEIQLDAAARHVLDRGWDDTLAAPLASLAVELLEDRIDRLSEAEARVATARTAPSADPGAHAHSAWLLAAAGASAIAGVGLLAWAGLGGPSAAAAVGAALATAGLIGVLVRWGRPPRETGRASAPDPARDVARARADVLATLDGLPVRPDVLDPPGPSLAAGLRRLRDLAISRGERTRALATARERVAAVDVRARSVAAALGRNGAPTSESLAPQLDRDLREAERLCEAARSAEREVARLRREQSRIGGELDAARTRLSSLESRVAPLGGGDPLRGAAVAGRRMDAHRRADQLREELERGHPDLAELEERLRQARADAPGVDDAEVARRRAHLEELESAVEQLIARAEALERDAAHLRELETVDAVDSEIATLQETEARLMRERDRKWVLAQLVREADRRFREEHQPDLVRRASEHLAHLTNGRYDRLLIDEADPGAPFQLMGPALPAPVALRPPISTGTLEQAYLSLRLAIVDHLDEGHESLPLFIDEAFVNWDPRRRARGLDVLADLSDRRQLFVFTCHPEMAGQLVSRGGRLIELERGR